MSEAPDVLPRRPLGSDDPAALQAQVLAYARDLRVALERGREATRDLARTHLETVAALAAAVDVRDEVTGGHVYRVANYGTVLARDLEPALVDDPQLVYGFLLHDIGKLAIPDAVLRKDGPL
ncbi:MAG: phosphohydrolase, partial [Actinobacteria bacterium]|nr:phosphohydrolase [Actinomycetota bacterium]